jgi:hypothetical protein
VTVIYEQQFVEGEKSMLGKIPGLGIVRSIALRFVLPLVLLLPLSAPAQTWKWTIEDVDTDAEQTSIVADREGNLHLAYAVPAGYGELRYAFRSAENSRWYKMTLDHNLGVLSTGIALDSKGNPSICYTPRAMKYAHWDGQKWNLQEVDPGTGLIAYYCSVEFTHDDRPQLSWYLETIFVLRHATLEDGIWKARSVEAGTESGKWNSLALDHNDLPHLAYNSFKGGELKYAYFDGKDWVRSVLDSPIDHPNEGLRGLGVSLVLDAKGNPRISYYDLHSLKYVRFDGTKWVTEVVEQLPPFTEWGWKNFRSTQLLDRSGNPHISYESHLGLKHAWWDGTKWHTQLIKAPVGNLVFESWMAADQNDNFYISFKDPADGSLKVAIGKPSASPQTVSAEMKANPKN